MIPAPLVLSFAAMDSSKITSRRKRGLIGAFKGTVSLGICINFVIDSQGISSTIKKQTVIQLLPYVLGIVCPLYIRAVCVYKGDERFC